MIENSQPCKKTVLSIWLTVNLAEKMSTLQENFPVKKRHKKIFSDKYLQKLILFAKKNPEFSVKQSKYSPKLKEKSKNCCFFLQ